MSNMALVNFLTFVVFKILDNLFSIWCITFSQSFCHYKIQLLWWTVPMHFGMRTSHLQKAVLRMKLLLSLQYFIWHIAHMEVWKHVFTRAILKFKIFHLCRSRIAIVLRLPHLCCTCVVLVTLVSHSCRSCFTRVSLILHISYTKFSKYKICSFYYHE